jgi:predicted NodU family carbamoyl transferase
MTYVLGISAYYHDSAAALVRDGEIVAAAQEERFSRKKHDRRFPHRAVNFCLGEAFIEPPELDGVVFYDNPLLTLDRVLKNSVTVAPSGRDQFVEACRALLGAKARVQRDLEQCLGEPSRLLLTHHHMAHAASCFYPSPFDSAAILIIDGVGEWATSTLGVGAGNRIELLEELRYPHSLGLLYSAFTYHCGFKVNSGEYKLMGLAPYGEPRYAKRIRDEIIDVRDDGSFRLNTSAFGFLDSPVMTNACFDELFGGPARPPDSPITRREMDLAASIQEVTEEVVLRLVARVTELTGLRNLVMAGGVALNCVANGRVLREAGLEGLFVQPAAGDAGGALGAALLASHQVFDAPRKVSGPRDAMNGSLLGPAFAPHEVEAYLDRTEIPQDRGQPARRSDVSRRRLGARRPPRPRAGGGPRRGRRARVRDPDRQAALAAQRRPCGRRGDRARGNQAGDPARPAPQLLFPRGSPRRRSGGGRADHGAHDGGAVAALRPLVREGAARRGPRADARARLRHLAPRSACTPLAFSPAALWRPEARRLKSPAYAGLSSSSPGWTRTNNPPVNSRMLCQLSYRGTAAPV